ncbi:MAG: zf-HC2 domain-containing protein [Phycisphaerae bacterium]|nr:zf-HC2 domain-containing protein [Gemmatimonadaceae bacterium]
MNPAPIDCESAMKDLWDYLDDELPPHRTEQIRVHLETCVGCDAHMQFCRSFLTQIDLPVVSATHLAQLRDKVHATLQREGIVLSR